MGLPVAAHNLSISRHSQAQKTTKQATLARLVVVAGLVLLDVTFLVGENGSGKSTVLEGIAQALGFSPEGGTRNVQLETTRPTSDFAGLSAGENPAVR